MGAHAPRQVAVTQAVVENPQADQYEDLEKWMGVADKIAQSCYGSGREDLTHNEPESPGRRCRADDARLLRAEEAGELDPDLLPGVQRPVRRERVSDRRSLEGDDDDD